MEADYWAKEFLEYAKDQETCQAIPYEPWSLWYKGRKLMKKKEKIYEIVQGGEAFQYWTQKEKVEPLMLEYVAWKGVEHALEMSTRLRQHFITKHTMGICGVGKWMKCWKKWTVDSCPRCGLPAMADHVWACKGEQLDKIWDQAITNLKERIVKANMDPEILHAIIHSLQPW